MTALGKFEAGAESLSIRGGLSFIAVEISIAKGILYHAVHLA